MLKEYCNLSRQEDCALLLGGFDGFHNGHMLLLKAAQRTALPIGLTSFFGGKEGGALFTLDERDVIFARLGFAFCIKREFTEEFRNLSAEEFLKELFACFRVKAVFCGEDFRFGKGASGTVALLKALAPCPVTALPLASAEGEKISSTRLKELVRAGDMKRLNALLPLGYFVQGAVEHGRAVGKSLGFPTLNLSFKEGKLPLKEGVYAGRAETEQGEYGAVINVGARPTFREEERKIEAHLIGFSGDLYGSTVRVYPKRYLRPVKAFASREELILQLEHDLKSTEEEG